MYRGDGSESRRSSSKVSERTKDKLAELGSKLFGGGKEKNRESTEVNKLFEQMLDDRGIHGAARTHMLGFDSGRKHRLIVDWQQTRKTTDDDSLRPTSYPQSATGPSARAGSRRSSASLASSGNLSQGDASVAPRGSTGSLGSETDERLERHFAAVLDRLKIHGSARDTMMHTLDAKRKKEVIQQYRRRREIERQSSINSQQPGHPWVGMLSPVIAPVEQLGHEDLDRVFRKVLDELDIKGSARDNLLSMEPAQRKDVIKQYQHVRRTEGDLPKPLTSLSSNPPPPPPRTASNSSPSLPARSDSLQTASPSTLEDLGDQSPARFISLLANR
ncbi:hypothetical protein DFS34DRAFT_456098 [Phlyctochytrium arcticum]|nr:hypothetical protein DFS34DRAFT_456098 [Phlyctochytrium arcticum]